MNFHKILWQTAAKLWRVAVKWNNQHAKPSHDKTNKMAVAGSEDSDQPGRPPSLIRVFTLGIYPVWSQSSLSPWRYIGSSATHWAHCEDWSDWADAQADLSHRWAHRSFCWFCHVVAQIMSRLTCISQLRQPSQNYLPVFHQVPLYVPLHMCEVEVEMLYHRSWYIQWVWLSLKIKCTIMNFLCFWDWCLFNVKIFLDWQKLDWQCTSYYMLKMRIENKFCAFS